jgi:hypothetical protein
MCLSDEEKLILLISGSHMFLSNRRKNQIEETLERGEFVIDESKRQDLPQELSENGAITINWERIQLDSYDKLDNNRVGKKPE